MHSASAFSEDKRRICNYNRGIITRRVKWREICYQISLRRENEMRFGEKRTETTSAIMVIMISK